MTAAAETTPAALPPAPAEKSTAEVLKGWDDIAAVLEVHHDAAQRYAARDVDPLPVWYDHAERPRLHVSAAQAWIDRQALFFRTFHALKDAGLLPSQRRAAARAEGAAKKPRRHTRVGARGAKKKAKKG